MSFGASTTFSNPRSRRQKPVSTKWVDLQPRERKAPGLQKVGRKTEFWIFVNQILETFFVKIELPRICEIQSDFCDGYHIAKAHTRRRSVIRTDNWYHALRVCWACQECHAWADQRERDDSESIIEGIIQNRFRRMDLSDEKVRQLLLECAEKVQADNPKFESYLVVL